MMGFTVIAGQALGIVDKNFPSLSDYSARSQTCPALQKAISQGG